jgi:hypothetical protein
MKAFKYYRELCTPTPRIGGVFQLILDRVSELLTPHDASPLGCQSNSRFTGICPTLSLTFQSPTGARESIRGSNMEFARSRNDPSVLSLAPTRVLSFYRRRQTSPPALRLLSTVAMLVSFLRVRH